MGRWRNVAEVEVRDGRRKVDRCQGDGGLNMKEVEIRERKQNRWRAERG